MAEPDEPLLVFNPIGSKAQVVAFSSLDKHLITGHENGKVALWDVNTGEEVASKEKNHIGLITDLQMSADRTYFVTSSKDKSARVSLSINQLDRLASAYSPGI
jgi:translation initiation factor 3 subunit I